MGELGARFRFASFGLCVLALAACSGETIDPDPRPSSTTGVFVTTTSAPNSTTTSLPTEELVALSDGLPRTGTYGFIDVTIEVAEMGRIVPASYLRDQQDPGEDLYLFLTMEVSNTSLEYTANWTPSPYGLTISGEPSGAPMMLEGRPHIGLTAGTSTDAVVAFELPPDVGFEDIEFTLAEEDKVPLVVPLAGDMPDWPWPIEVAVDTVADIEGDGISCAQSLTVEIFGGEVGVDLLDTEGRFVGSRRVSDGELFLTVDGRVTNHGGNRCGGGSTNVTGDSVRIYVDGVPRAPVGFVNVNVPSDAALDVAWHFVYDVDAAEVEFLFGDPDSAHVVVPVDLSAVDGL